MKRMITCTLLASALMLAAPIHSAGFVKIDGIDGEVAEPASPERIRDRDTARPAGLLLPAVQQVREPGPGADTSEGTRKGNVEYHWKVEEGRK